MNVNHLIFVLPSAVALFWIVRIFFLKSLNKVQLFIISGMLMSLLTLFNGGALALFVFPMYHFAVREKTSPTGLGKWDWITLLPPVLFIPYTDTLCFSVFLSLQVVGVSVWSVVAVRRYTRKVAELYDSGSDMSGDDISQVLIYVIITAVLISGVVIMPQEVFSLSLFRIVIALFMAVLQYLIGDCTYRMKDTSEVVQELEEIPQLTDSLQSENAPEGNRSAEDDELIRRVVDEQLFLDPNISLVTLAERLNTNRTYLSNSIHSCRGQNFSDFLNSLRISYFINLVKSEGRDVNIKDAAMRSGYSSLQSFYRNFSIIMQMTPKNWISENIR